MPFVVAEEKRGVNWFLLLGILLGMGFVVLVAYYLFFAPLPLLETLLPAQSQFVVEISKANFQPNDVVNNPAFQALKQYAPVFDVGEVGRANPFLPF